MQFRYPDSDTAIDSALESLKRDYGDLLASTDYLESILRVYIAILNDSDIAKLIENGIDYQSLNFTISAISNRIISNKFRLANHPANPRRSSITGWSEQEKPSMPAYLFEPDSVYD